MAINEKTLSDEKLKRLSLALSELHRMHSHPAAKRWINDLRNLVLYPTRERWDALHNTALGPNGTLSLWQATCYTSPDYPNRVAIRGDDSHDWTSVPTSEMLLQALMYAVS
jgi:hypothetical protein